MDRTGQLFGKYRLIRLLGQGGFAEVYLGKHVLMGALAAIKILPNQITPADSQMFLQEARTLVALEHSNIVGVKDCDIQDGIPFIVVDYAPNGTLRQRHPKGTRVLLANVIIYVSQIAPALQYAHNLRLIHRDVKPENMLLGRDDQVLLSDFGIAVIFSTALSRYAKDSAGTAIYMAPEQIMGQPRPASDQYSLGIVVYEWLCGDPPFRGTQVEITSQHLHAPPPPIYAQGVNIPPAVEAVIMKALAKQPEDRFPSVQDFALALSNSNPQQQTNRPNSNTSTSSNQSIAISHPDRSAQFTHTPVPPGITPANPTPHLTPPIQPFPGSTPHMLPATLPGQYLTPTMPSPTPARRSKAGCVIGSIVSTMLVAALVLGAVFFVPKLFSLFQGSPGTPTTGPGPQITTTTGSSQGTSLAMRVEPLTLTATRGNDTSDCRFWGDFYKPNDGWNCNVNLYNNNNAMINWTARAPDGTQIVFRPSSTGFIEPGGSWPLTVHVPGITTCPAQISITISVDGGSSTQVAWNCTG